MTVDLFQAAACQVPNKLKEIENEELKAYASELRQKLGKDLFIPGHHYQKDEIIQFADATGDSLQLAQLCADNRTSQYIVFCGVHFMAETADILTSSEQKVLLPDLRAGCSMADMATFEQTERAWKNLVSRFGDTIIPVTYVNSSAEIKAFVGRHGGATVTSSNAKQMLKWAFSKKKRILFLPDQHLGRNTAYDLGIPLEEMIIWNPIIHQLEEDNGSDSYKMILWKGHCSVHENFRTEHIEHFRIHEPDRKILVHPECSWEVTQKADLAGSTKYIIDQIESGIPGEKWAIGTEMNLVNRLKAHHPEQSIVSLNQEMCPCLTMNRIDLPHFTAILESLVAGEVRNQITVDAETKESAKLAIMRMLDPL